MDGAIIYIIFAGIGIAIVTLYYKHQSRQIAIQQKEFNLLQHKPITVQYTVTTSGALEIPKDVTINAEMYVFDNFIYLKPKRNTIFSSLLFHYLPVVFTKDPESVKRLTKLNNVYTPDTVSQVSKYGIKLEYQTQSIGRIKYVIILELLDDQHLEAFSDILNLLDTKNPKSAIVNRKS